MIGLSLINMFVAGTSFMQAVHSIIDTAYGWAFWHGVMSALNLAIALHNVRIKP